MKVIILSVSAGAGHKCAAEAIENYILEKEPNSDIQLIDTLKYINPIIDKLVIGSYLSSIKITPSIYGKIYYHSENDDALAGISNIFNEILAFKIMHLIRDTKPEIIIATHPFPTEMLSILKRKNKLHIPVICIMTDYAAHSFWVHPNIDAYIVSNEDMLYEMKERGVQDNIVYNFGIPVNSDFTKKFNKEDTLSELQLDTSKITLLIMGGSLGLGKIATIYESLNTIEQDIQIIVIAGNNKKLFSELSKLKEKSNKDTRIIGYTNNVNKYMQSCDLLLTKPGGLTITEALISATPLALFSCIPGHEEKNAEFLLRHNLAIQIGDVENCSEIISNILSSPQKLEEMKENCRKYSKPDSCSNIYLLMKDLIKDNLQSEYYETNQ